LRTLCAFSILVYSASFDLANRGVRQPVQPHTSFAPLLVCDKTLAQPHFAVVNCSDAMMSMFYSPVLTRSLYFWKLRTAVSQRWVKFIYPNLERWYSHSVQM